MIYDRLENIETYKGLSEDLYEGLKFLKDASSDLAKGVHQINSRVKAIVSEYETMAVNENGYEAHRANIDIQFLLSGREKACGLPLDFLKETTPYDEAVDAAFYTENGVKPQELIIDNSHFAIFFPQDGHMPQLSLAEPMKVKKVVVKVKI